MIKEKFTKFFATQKFRFDISVQFLIFLNFAVNVIGASDKIQLFINKTFGVLFDLYFIIGVGIFVSFFAAWLFGYILDAKLSYWQHIRKIQTDRNLLFKKIEEDLEWLKNQHIKNTTK